MNSPKTVFQVIRSSNGPNFRVHAVFNPEFLEITALQGNKAYRKIVMKEEMELTAMQIQSATFDEYYGSLLEYFEKLPENILFTLVESVFKVIVVEDDIKISYFTTELEKISYVECVEDFLDTFYSEKETTRKKLDILENEYLEAKNNLEEYQCKLIDLTDRKNKSENDMLGQFVLILNKKKERIRLLQQHLDAFREGRPMSDPVVEINGKKRKTNKKKEPVKIEVKHEISASEEEEVEEEENNYNTDDENQTERNVSILEKTQDENFYLLDESPPREFAILPKRVPSSSNWSPNYKQKQNLETVNEGASTSGLTNAAKKRKIDEEENFKSSENTKNITKKLAFEINTQDLLDMI